MSSDLPVCLVNNACQLFRLELYDKFAYRRPGGPYIVGVCYYGCFILQRTGDRLNKGYTEQVLTTGILRFKIPINAFKAFRFRFCFSRRQWMLDNLASRARQLVHFVLFNHNQIISTLKKLNFKETTLHSEVVRSYNPTSEIAERYHETYTLCDIRHYRTEIPTKW